MTARRVAAIDCGTNSIRLLIADARGSSLTDIQREMEIVRLGHGVDRTGKLDPAAIERTLDATRRYAALIEQHGVQAVRFAATSASRDASNRQVFIDGVRDILGIEPEVIAGNEEARLSYLGAIRTLEDPGTAPHLVVDIGGGSTEFVVGEAEPLAQVSVDMGSVRFTERHFGHDPVTAEGLKAARREIDALLDQADAAVDFSRVRSIVGVAGTITTLTAVAQGVQEYSPDVTHGARLDSSRLRELALEVATESKEAHRMRPAIHPGRIDVISAGALIWARIIERVAGPGGEMAITTSEHDILDGIAMSVAESLQ